MEGPIEEKKRRQKAMVTTGVIQVVLLLIFYFLVAWREPNPPNPEYGIELNFGLNDTGAGKEPVESPTQSDVTEQETTESSETSNSESQESNEQKTPVEPVKNPNADVAEEKAEASKPKQTQSTPTKTPTEKPNTSQGDTGGKGDQGDPKGDINKDALYGDPGGGSNGAALKLTGWKWDSPPDPKDSSQESGRIVFKIFVDENGYLERHVLVESTVSPTVRKYYEAAIEKLTFTRTTGDKPAPTSEGTITFIIRAK